MLIQHYPNNYTYKDVSIGDCFQSPSDNRDSLFMKTPPLFLDGCKINALNLYDLCLPVYFENSDIVIPKKTKLEVFDLSNMG